MTFSLFILVTAILIIRPNDLTPSLSEYPIYESVIIVCLFLSIPDLLGQLTPEGLVSRPITVCVLGLTVAVALSHLVHGEWEKGYEGTLLFAKFVAYYLLLVAQVTTAARLRNYLFFLTAFIAIMVTLAVLRFHGLIDLGVWAAAKTTTEVSSSAGDSVDILRLNTGFFDPNELCLILVLAIMISLYGLKVHRSFYLRGAWLAGLGGAGYSLYLTQSRGGFLALAASLVTWGWLRFGKRKGLLASAVALFGLLVIFGGRQTTFNLYQGTAKGRIQLWADSLALFLKNPLFGAGKDLVEQVAGQVTHNAFLQSFAELGVFGGTLFVGAWYLGLKGLYSWRPAGLEPRDLDLGELRLCLLPALVGYAVGLLSLSFIYVSPTYLVLGLATAFIVLGEQAGGWQGDRLQVKLLFRLVILSAVVLVAIYFFTRFTVDWGV